MVAKVGPNDRCPCGSGRKFKRCCTREPEPPSAEQLFAVREFKEEHYSRWRDTPLAALGGLTPRQAAKHRERRIELDVTLKQIERTESSVPVAGRFDVEALRRDLGI